MPKCLLWENCWESPSGPHCIVPGVESHTLPVSPREEMSEARPITRDLFIETLLYEQLPGPPLAAGVSSMTESLGTLDLIHCLEGSNQMALRLASIGDEMDLRLRSPRLAQLPGMAMHSLALTYSQTGVRGVLRNFIHGLTHLWENMRSWRLPTPSTWVFPDQVCRQLLPSVLLAVLLLGGILHLVLQ
uniref:Bcl-2-interacting killer isoform X2 n=2 Tax=Castor canadensis TaxID=51338 RepID=A0A8C0WE14_CASCN|nr:bcl-2-interacting killer isoform X2 [Castor canadensis]